MIKKCYLLILIMLLTSALGFALLYEDNISEPVVEHIPINKDKPIVLNCVDLNVELIGWDNDNISILRTDLLSSFNTQALSIEDDNNSLTISGYNVNNQINSCLDTWLPIAQIKSLRTDNPLFSVRSHLIVYLPKNSEVVINCNNLKYSSDLIIKTKTID